MKTRKCKNCKCFYVCSHQGKIESAARQIFNWDYHCEEDIDDLNIFVATHCKYYAEGYRQKNH